MTPLADSPYLLTAQVPHPEQQSFCHGSFAAIEYFIAAAFSGKMMQAHCAEGLGAIGLITMPHRQDYRLQTT